ncbi:MAG: S41 family peptidase, partial [Planctomycetota bacterium]|nr:S41 family peptidase [Planctomycetota bacterium]
MSLALYRIFLKLVLVSALDWQRDRIQNVQSLGVAGVGPALWLLVCFGAMGGNLEAQVKNRGNGPEDVFEELWSTFAERYAFFELRGVDWESQKKAFRPQVDSSTTDRELFEIFCKMLKPLNDGHVNLKARGAFKKSFNAETEAKFYQEFSNGKQIKQFNRAVDETLERAGFDDEKKRAGILLYRTSEDYGYLRVLEVEGPSTRQLNRALDEILKAFQGKKGIVVDIRDNPGGTDKCVYTIVRRFADRKRVGHYRETKKGPGPKDFSPKKTVFLEPYEGLTFIGPTVCLTNDASFSGADMFALLMTALPQVKMVGEPTNGIFSNMLEKKLKNGWRYSLSHQRYYSPEMICYEGKGVPVDIQVKN